MNNFTLNENIKSIALKQIINLLDDNPDKNIPKIINLLERIDKKKTLSDKIEAIRSAMNKDSNWYQLTSSLWDDINDDVRKKMFENFVINASMISFARTEASEKKYNCNIPWAILMDPTTACNLKCKGCWASDYGHNMNMSFETMDDIINQANELGTFMFIFSGGEPLVRKKDIIKLCEKHNDCMFLSFTNGTLIDEEFCKELLRVKNFIPAISVEGFEEATDQRRGKNTFKAVERAMSLMNKHKLPFGVSCCYTSLNYEEIGSEEYFDWIIEKGAKFAWFFTYMPIGVNAVPELMATAEQRAFMYDRVREFRKTKPLFTLDFWNDGEYVNGCVAGGRRYLHINANGDMEPCAFIHYSNYNIYEHTLLEGLQSPLFMAYRQNQPFNNNHLRPCPLLDNKDKLAEMVTSSHAHSTDLEHPEEVFSLCSKCHQKADLWAIKADEIWNTANKY